MAKDRSPMLAIYGAAAPVLARILIDHPALTRRVVLAATEVMHATAAYLQHASKGGISTDAMAAMMQHHHARDLLRMALPDAPPAMYRALARGGERAYPLEQYRRMAVVAAGPLGQAFLRGRLGLRRLSHHETVAAMDPAMIGLFNVVEENLSLAVSINSIIVYLRAHGAITDHDLTLPLKAGLPGLLRRLQGAMDRLRAPALAFQLPAGLRHIASVGELRQVGHHYANCLSDWHGENYWFALADGRAIYLTSDQFVLCLRPIAPGLFMLEEIHGHANSHVPADLRDATISDMRRSGVIVVVEEPRQALSQIARACSDRTVEGAALAHLADELQGVLAEGA